MLLNRRAGGSAIEIDEHIDMTSMVDVVFQLMTFLLLTYQASTEAAVEMPVAKFGVGVEETETIVLTVAPPKEAGRPAPWCMKVWNSTPTTSSKTTSRSSWPSSKA